MWQWLNRKISHNSNEGEKFKKNIYLSENYGGSELNQTFWPMSHLKQNFQQGRSWQWIYLFLFYSFCFMFFFASEVQFVRRMESVLVYDQRSEIMTATVHNNSREKILIRTMKKKNYFFGSFIRWNYNYLIT